MFSISRKFNHRTLSTFASVHLDFSRVLLPFESASSLSSSSLSIAEVEPQLGLCRHLRLPVSRHPPLKTSSVLGFVTISTKEKKKERERETHSDDGNVVTNPYGDDGVGGVDGAKDRRWGWRSRW